MTRRTLNSSLWAVALAAALVVPGRAQADDEEVLRAAKGRVTFRVYCANCHGTQGKGDGNLASILKVAPTDVTAIAAKNGGEFPTDRVTAAIDGRKQVDGHGSREMPIWGEAFGRVYSHEDGQSADSVAREKVREVVAYVRSIQKKR